jgi:hypothetical protein
MKVKCIDNDDGYLNLTIGKKYDAIDDVDGYYRITNDEGRSHLYYKERFEEVKEMEVENVLELEYQEVFDKVAVRIKYQNEEVLKRDNFIDEKIGVASISSPDFHMVNLYIRGSNVNMDDYCELITKEKAEEIKEKVHKINEKYGIRKRWRAKSNCFYYYVDSTSKVGSCRDFYVSVDDERYEIGNYFKTKKEAENVAKKIEQIFKEM